VGGRGGVWGEYQRWPGSTKVAAVLRHKNSVGHLASTGPPPLILSASRVTVMSVFPSKDTHYSLSFCCRVQTGSSCISWQSLAPA